MHRPADKVRARVRRDRVQAADRVRRVQDRIGASRTGHGDDFSCGHHKARPIGNVCEQQQLRVGRALQDVVVGRQDIGRRRRFGHREPHHLYAAVRSQVVHRGHHVVVVQVAVNHRVTRFQVAIVHDQAGQAFAAAARKGDLIRAHSQQACNARAGLFHLRVDGVFRHGVARVE